MAFESAINTLMTNGTVALLAIQALVDGYAIIKVTNWMGKN